MLYISANNQADVVKAFTYTSRYLDDVLNCVFVTYQCGILGRVWYLILLIPVFPPFYFA